MLYFLNLFVLCSDIHESKSVDSSSDQDIKSSELISSELLIDSSSKQALIQKEKNSIQIDNSSNISNSDEINYHRSFSSNTQYHSKEDVEVRSLHDQKYKFKSKIQEGFANIFRNLIHRILFRAKKIDSLIAILADKNISNPVKCLDRVTTDPLSAINRLNFFASIGLSITVSLMLSFCIVGAVIYEFSSINAATQYFKYGLFISISAITTLYTLNNILKTLVMKVVINEIFGLLDNIKYSDSASFGLLISDLPYIFDWLKAYILTKSLVSSIQMSILSTFFTIIVGYLSVILFTMIFGFLLISQEFIKYLPKITVILKILESSKSDKEKTDEIYKIAPVVPLTKEMIFSILNNGAPLLKTMVESSGETKKLLLDILLKILRPIFVFGICILLVIPIAIYAIKTNTYSKEANDNDRLLNTGIYDFTKNSSIYMMTGYTPRAVDNVFHTITQKGEASSENYKIFACNIIINILLFVPLVYLLSVMSSIFDAQQYSELSLLFVGLDKSISSIIFLIVAIQGITIYYFYLHPLLKLPELLSSLLENTRQLSEDSSKLTNVLLGIRTLLITSKQKNKPFDINAQNTGIVFNKVNISYSQSEDTTDTYSVIKDFTETIKPGEIVVLIGETGCGKSTLLRSSIGLQVPESGNILLNGMIIQEIDYREMRKHVLCMAQLQLMPIDTLMEIMSLGLQVEYKNGTKTLTYLQEGDIQQVMDLAQFDDSLRSRRFLFEKEVSAKNLSGGQMQRLLLSIIMSILMQYIKSGRKLFVLAMDEIDSAVGREMSYKIHNAVLYLIEEIARITGVKPIIIIVEHSGTAIQYADRVFYFQKQQREYDSDPLFKIIIDTPAHLFTVNDSFRSFCLTGGIDLTDIKELKKRFRRFAHIMKYIDKK